VQVGILLLVEVQLVPLAALELVDIAQVLELVLVQMIELELGLVELVLYIALGQQLEQEMVPNLMNNHLHMQRLKLKRTMKKSMFVVDWVG